MGILIGSSVLVAAERGTLDLDRLLHAWSGAGGARRHHGRRTAPRVHRQKGARRARAEAFVERLVAEVPVVPFDLAAARVHATLSADLRSRGTPVGTHDRLIAATAILLGYSVATRDLRSFPRIAGLTVLQW